jgi:phospholipase D1/2
VCRLKLPEFVLPNQLFRVLQVMIQDDETLNIGSANLNERSLDGGRDTEVAMGAFQPHATMQPSQASQSSQTPKTAQSPGLQTPHGDVYGFRMSLWAEHFGGKLDPVFEDPSSLECLRLFNQKADEIWEKYAEAKVANMEAHIMAFIFWLRRTARWATSRGAQSSRGRGPK